MIAYWAKRTPGEEFEQLRTPLEKAGVWVSGTTLSDDELHSIIKSNDLNANIVFDVRDRGELPRVEYSDGVCYMFLRVPHLSKTGRIATLPMLSVVKGNRFFTLSIGEGIAPDSLSLTTLPITTEQTPTLLLGTMAASITTFEELLQHTARSITDTANRLRTHEITSHDFIHFVTVEANLHHSRMNLDSTLAMAHRLRENNHEILDETELEALDDIMLHINQLIVSTQSHLETVNSIRNAYGTIANNALNNRMKTLTVFTVLIALPNVFYGMFGMNVPLPFQHEAWSYGAVVGFTILLLFLVYLIAKKMRVF